MYENDKTKPENIEADLRAEGVIKDNTETEKKDRPRVLYGMTQKIKVVSSIDGKPTEVSYYITINSLKDSKGVYRPYEIFINTSDNSSTPWMTLISKLLSAIFRSCYEQETDASFICRNMKGIINNPYYVKDLKKTVNSIPAHIGEIIENTIKVLNEKSQRKDQ